MGLDKRQRAELKALKNQKRREYRRKSKEWVRSLNGDTHQGYSDEWEYENGFRFPKAFGHDLPKETDI
jgi:hypothetical protein